AAPAAAAPVPPSAAPARAPEAAPAPAAVPQNARALELRVGPMPYAEQADNLVDLFKEITDLGTIEPIDGGVASDGYRRFRIVTTSADSDLLDLFTFHVAREHVMLLPFG